MARLLARLRRNRAGAAIVEFALIAPVLTMILMGLFDTGYNMYATTVLQGAVQKAGRDSSIEGSVPSVLDQQVSNQVHQVVRGASLSFERKAYENFSDVSRAEDFNDLNSDGVCNDNEPFEDANGNGTWDADRAVLGQGGARDAVLYSVTMDYPRAFPLARYVPGIGENFTVTAETVLRNQPYENVGGAPATGNCA